MPYGGSISLTKSRTRAMATNVRIIQARDCVKVTPDGWLDLERSKALLLEVAALIAPLSEFHIILDTRKAESRMTSTDLWDLASELKRLGAAFPGKTAVLCPLERFDKAGFFAISAQRMGFRISAFTSFEEAIEWLIADETLL